MVQTAIGVAFIQMCSLRGKTNRDQAVAILVACTTGGHNLAYQHSRIHLTPGAMLV